MKRRLNKCRIDSFLWVIMVGYCILPWWIDYCRIRYPSLINVYQVIKNMFDDDVVNKTGGSSDLFAEKLAQKNKLDEAKDVKEQTCEGTVDESMVEYRLIEDDANFYNLHKDIVAIVEKTNTKVWDWSIDSQLSINWRRIRYTVGGRLEGRNKRNRQRCPIREIRDRVRRRKNPNLLRYGRELEGGGRKSIQKVTSTEFDAENDVNEKNFMYNLKEIDYCTHDMMRCVEEVKRREGRKERPIDCRIISTGTSTTTVIWFTVSTQFNR